MEPTYKELLAKVTPLYHQDPERFMRFYHAVNNLVAGIPEGKSIRIDDHCKPAVRELFIRIASMYIMEITAGKESPLDGYLEFIDNYNVIRHVARIVPITSRRHLNPNRR